MSSVSIASCAISISCRARREPAAIAQAEEAARDLALFDLGIDSKLRGCDLVRLRVRDTPDGSLCCSGTAIDMTATSPVHSRKRVPPETSSVEQAAEAMVEWAFSTTHV